MSTTPPVATVSQASDSTASAATHKWNVALIGNPNTGKSTLFNALGGLNARVGNYPGVTVEKKVGKFRHAGESIQLIDLPGTYSLSPRSIDEMVSVNVLLGTQKELEPLDAVICIVDATHLQRNLYLFSQILDLGLPTLLVLNMWDEVEKQGLQIDVDLLQQRLGFPVIPVSARKGQGIERVKAVLLELLQQTEKQKQTETTSPPTNAESSASVPASPERLELFPPAFQQARSELALQVEQTTGRALPLYLAERLLLDVQGETEREVLQHHPNLSTLLAEKRQQLNAAGCPIPAIEPRVRYGWVKTLLQDVVQTPAEKPASRIDRLDRWLTHTVVGPLVFAAVMLLMFQAIYSWSGPLMEAIEGLQEAAGELIIANMAPGALRSLLVDGLVGGVGSVIVFLPQIAILFLFIAVLEDCGYMARAAYIMDRLMTKVGLSGKSFVPLMSSYACAIPGIMATRTIENRKDRMVTLLIAPLMSCSARLPVYLLLINAFIPNQSLGGTWITTRAMVLFGFYLLGAAVAVPVAWLLKKTWFRGEPAPLVMELPNFKWPSLRVVFYRVWDRSKAFLVTAGSLIFMTTVLVWAAGYFPGDHSSLDWVDVQLESPELKADDPRRELLEEQRRHLASELLNNSFLGRAGHAIEPVVRPLGWDWRIGISALASFPAREVIIGTLGTIFSLGSDVKEDDPGLMAKLQSAQHPDGSPLFNIPVALSIMVFFALCAQCGATLMVIKRETNSWRWPIFSFVYMTTLAYVGALIVYQVGMLFV